MIRTAHRWLPTLVILAVVLGCDNVSWGGIDVRLEGPPVADAPVPEPVATEVRLPELPSGPVLFRVDRSGSSATAAPIAEISGDSLLPLADESDEPGFRQYFVQERMAPGHELVLFAEGARVGRFLAGDSSWVDAGTCSSPPVVSGIVELLPSAVSVTRFLALRSADASAPPHAQFQPLQADQAIRTAAANIAGTIIMDVGARWPPSMAAARGDVQLLRVADDEPPIIAGTYLYQDEMTVVPAPAGAYSFFYLAEDHGVGHRFSYYWFRPAEEDGKGAARYFGHHDWDGDGVPEVLLEVLGANARWHAALSRTSESWVRTFEDPCGAPERQALLTSR